MSAKEQEKMTQDSDSRRLRAKQVGMLMQAYRRSYLVEGKTGRLSQDGLLRLMAQVDDKYSERYDHSTVARWESGSTRPTKDRLEVFGRALSLSPVEVEGLIGLAGLNEVHSGARQHVPVSTREYGEPVPEQPDASETADAVAGSSSYVEEAIRYFLSRFTMPGLLVAGSGFVLAYLGWNAAWMMMLYLIVAIGLVLVQGFFRLRHSNDLRELLFISVFFVLAANILQVPIVRMDPYGFYAVANWAGTPIPYLLALLVSLLMALAAGLIFDFMWRWQYTSGRGSAAPARRAMGTAFLPLIFVYVCNLVLGGLGTWIYLLFVFSILGGTFATLLLLRDAEVSFKPWERKVLLQAGLAASIVLTAAASAAILVIYLQPSMLVLPDHTLIRSWEIDFSALGYSPIELMDRYRVGAVWSSLATLVFMVIVVGGNLITSIYRLDSGDPHDPEDAKPRTEQAAAVAEPAPRRKRAPRRRVDFRGWVDWLSGKVISPAGGRLWQTFR